jgi:hypothetical protein
MTLPTMYRMDWIIPRLDLSQETERMLSFELGHWLVMCKV